MISEDIQHQIMELKASEKIHLVELIFESLNKSDLEIQNKWVKESEQRYEAFKKGEVKSFSYEEVMSMLEK
ncbi:MAG: addiction module protein [Melioribacteraceae bacterium]